MSRPKTRAFLVALRGYSTWVALIGVLSLCLAPTALAAPASSKKKKRPSASKQLKAAFKNLSKAKYYEVSLKIQGGVSKDADHTISTAAVRETYQGNVYSNKLMHIPGMKAFRTSKKGVYYTGGMWRHMTGRGKATVMNRLFTFPQIALYKANRYASRAKWVESSIAKPAEYKELDFDLDVDKDDEGKGTDEEKKKAKKKSKKSATRKKSSKRPSKKTSKNRGKTVVVSKKENKKDGELIPRIVRVKTPSKEALAHFLAVENSGCLSAG